MRQSQERRGTTGEARGERRESGRQGVAGLASAVRPRQGKAGDEKFFFRRICAYRRATGPGKSKDKETGEPMQRLACCQYRMSRRGQLFLGTSNASETCVLARPEKKSKTPARSCHE